VWKIGRRGLERYWRTYKEMDINALKALTAGRCPSQNPVEWQCFMEFVSAYFENRGIECPVVVELGIWHGKQRRFYEEFLGAKYIGIDITAEKGVPEIMGDTHDPKTFERLKDLLGGKSINLLFIDAGHTYQDVKRDYEIYAPLTKNIIAIHDIMLHREEVRLFWNEIDFPQEYVVESILAPVKFHPEKLLVGIGLIIKEW